MIDSISLRMDISPGQKDYIAGNIKNQSRKYYPESESELIKGEFRTLRITLNETYITIRGSLPKFLYGNNLINFKQSDIEKIKRLFTGKLKLDVGAARIMKIDISQTMHMNHPVAEYITSYQVDNLSQHKIHIISDETVTFRNSMRSITLYDKAKQMQDTNVVVDYEVKNALRYEVKLKQKLAKELSLSSKPIFDDLLKSKVYNKLIYYWLDYFLKLPYFSSPTVEPTTSVKDLTKMLAGKGLKVVGINNLLSQISNWSSEKNINRFQHRDLKKKIKEIAEYGREETSKCYVEELQNNVVAICEKQWCNNFDNAQN